jgi:hypothetical protein
VGENLLRDAGCGGAAENPRYIVRTFLVALPLNMTDCREASGAYWAGRSPRLGSIAMCRPTSQDGAGRVAIIHVQIIAHGLS